MGHGFPVVILSWHLFIVQLHGISACEHTDIQSEAEGIFYWCLKLSLCISFLPKTFPCNYPGESASLKCSVSPGLNKIAGLCLLIAGLSFLPSQLCSLEIVSRPKLSPDKSQGFHRSLMCFYPLRDGSQFFCWLLSSVWQFSRFL